MDREPLHLLSGEWRENAVIGEWMHRDSDERRFIAADRCACAVQPVLRSRNTYECMRCRTDLWRMKTGAFDAGNGQARPVNSIGGVVSGLGLGMKREQGRMS